MKYMLLLCVDEQIWDKVNETERQQMVEESVKIANQIDANGQYLAAARLQPAATATTIRVRDGKRLVTDGPFAETREYVGGYFLIDVNDLDEAISIASRIPATRVGSVEIRPVMDIAGLPPAK
jgi:hypothetical protein